MAARNQEALSRYHTAYEHIGSQIRESTTSMSVWQLEIVPLVKEIHPQVVAATVVANKQLRSCILLLTPGEVDKVVRNQDKLIAMFTPYHSPNPEDLIAEIKVRALLDTALPLHEISHALGTRCNEVRKDTSKLKTVPTDIGQGVFTSSTLEIANALLQTNKDMYAVFEDTRHSTRATIAGAIERLGQISSELEAKMPHGLWAPLAEPPSEKEQIDGVNQLAKRLTSTNELQFLEKNNFERGIQQLMNMFAYAFNRKAKASCDRLLAFLADDGKNANKWLLDNEPANDIGSAHGSAVMEE